MSKERAVHFDDDEDEKGFVRGINYLFVVGINSYSDTAYTPLNNAKKDAEDIVTLLTENYNFAKEHQLVLLDGDATRRKISNSLKDFAKKVKEQDSILIYFAGHGYLDKSTKIGYLLPTDAEKGEIDSFLPNSTIIDLIGAIHSRHTLLVLDSCFSGSFFKDRGDFDSTHLAENVEKYPSRLALAAGMSETVSDGFHGDNSPFAKAFISFLKENTQQKIPAPALFHYVRTTVPGNAEQQPYAGIIYKTGDLQGEFVFHRKQNEAAAWEKALATNSLATFQAFIKHFPASPHIATAKKHIDQIEEDNLWADACKRNSVQAYTHYFQRHSKGQYASQARAKIDEIEEEEEWDKAKLRNKLGAYLAYLDQYPQGKHSKQASEYIEKLSAPISPPEEDSPKPPVIEPVSTNNPPASKFYASLLSNKKQYYYIGVVGLVILGIMGRWMFSNPDNKDAKPIVTIENTKKDSTEKALSPNMVLVKGGTFSMGSNDKEAESNEKPVHSVTLSDFYMGRYEVTVGEFKAFIDATGYKTDAEKDKSSTNWRYDCEGKVRPVAEYNHPVVYVSWNDATEYCKWLTKTLGKVYSLPSEAQWEYAARSGGKAYKYAWGNESKPTNHANVADETLKKKYTSENIFEGYTDGYVFTCPVDKSGVNEIGLYGMTGNVWEWCKDVYDAEYYAKSPKENPICTTLGADRVYRGGSWLNDEWFSRLSYRLYPRSSNRNHCLGFRLSLLQSV